MKNTLFATALLLPLFISCCTPLFELEEAGESFGLAGADLQPPVLISAGAPAEDEFRLSFNEELGRAELMAILPPIVLDEVECRGPELIIRLGEAQEAGREYALDLLVRDGRGNTQQLLVRCYGHNPRVPALLINEVTTQGSGTHPDMVELRVMSSGNLAGVCLYEGTCEDYDDRMLFPACEVGEGEYLIVHFKPEGIAAETDETEAVDESGGLDAHPEARDFWVPAGSGLSGNNGSLCLYADPFGELLDALLYSNRTSASDENYRGFGSSSVMLMADYLSDRKAWIGETVPLRPEDALDPEDSTATRSICRGSVPTDTDSAADWHIVPTSSFSFGAENCDEVYSP